VTEPISACLVNGICDFIQHARTVSFARDSYHIFAKQLLRNVIREIFTIFSPQIRHRVTGPLKKGKNTALSAFGSPQRPPWLWV